MQDTTEQNAKVHLAIEGEVTIYRAIELKEQILAAVAGAGEVEIDLSRVTEMDSSGLQIMVAAKLESILRGHRLSFSGHTQAVQQVIDLCELGGFFGDPVVISPNLH
ncbi:MAG: STAS domain-containing protein [Pseudomonadota bacterium]